MRRQFLIVLTVLSHKAFVALGTLRVTSVSAVKNEQVMKMRPKIFIESLHKLLLGLLGSFCMRKPYAVCHSKNVRIHSDCVFAVCNRRYDVCRFAPYALEFHKFVARFRHAAHIQNALTQTLYRLCFIMVKSARKYMPFKLFDRHFYKSLGRVCDFEKLARNLIYALVRTLGGQHHRNKQFKRRIKIQFAIGIVVHFVKQIVYFQVVFRHIFDYRILPRFLQESTAKYTFFLTFNYICRISPCFLPFSNVIFILVCAIEHLRIRE